MGEGPRGRWPPLEKLISLAGQKRKLGRTKKGAWQDRNGSLAGQKWEAWRKIISNTQHFESFSPIFACFSAIYHPICTLAEQFSRTAWQDSLVLLLGRTHGPPGRKKFWQEGIEFWQDEVVGPPLKMTQIRLWAPGQYLYIINVKRI